MTAQNNLIGYALSFASFLLDSKIGKEIKQIILFGSVARGDFTEESDIDLFIDAPDEIETEIEKILVLYESSQISKTWRLKSIKNEFSLKVGKLEEWSLRREVISSGITLYGKFSQSSEKGKYYILINLAVKKRKFSNQIRIWRYLYGYRQKVGKKIYLKKGLLEKCGGKKIGKGWMLIPMGQRMTILKYLNKEKIPYQLYELWSDNLG